MSIKIRVAGKGGSGKSAVVQVIAKALAEYGFDIEIKSIERHPLRSEDALATVLGHTRKRTPVVYVEEVHTLSAPQETNVVATYKGRSDAPAE